MIHKQHRMGVVAAALLASSASAAVTQSLGAPADRRGQRDEPEASKPAPVDLGALFRMHYDTRVRSFREQNLAYKNVVLLGDSITEGFEVTTYFPGRRVLNRGIGGDVIGNALPADDPRGVLRRLDCSVFDCAATDVFVMIGINDLNSGRDVDQMEEGYREILRRIKDRAPALRVHVQSLLPTRGEFAARNEPIREFNRRLGRLAEEFGTHFLNLHPLFTDADGQLKPDYTEDGLHLTEAGYRAWQAEVGRVMGWDTGLAQAPEIRPQP
ncbi:GDSL-type esterase/lipase family protein [Tautonia plasticadhaerens]|uniref:GDSL-like Lipase/Acylhydrolase n=1 Tax=Tautonia plasticadhaerens TaxID=2527974 RepID=A0A518HA81_9BACT|nr:GDSL-type esterase/lipase family protein [Tautonia plasticadhaerens]QDV37765.1 GDSL-like Lipase/Acylhydrolase [Tautonia plasticadhaerens]